MMPTDPPAERPDKPRIRPTRAQPLGILAVDGGMLTLETVSQLTGLGKSTIRKMVSRGEFPQPVHVTARAIRFPSEEIRIWLTRRPPV